MSLILDALRKSERTRQQTLTGRVSASDTPPARARVPIPWTTLLGLLLIANVIVLAIIFWRSPVATHTPARVATAASVTVATPAAAPAPVYRPAVRSLAAEAAAAGVAASPVPTPAAVTFTGAVVTTASSPPTTASAAHPATASAAPPAAGVIDLTAGSAPPLDTLPLAFQQSLPALNLDVHSYSSNPAERFVVINMRRYQAGDTLKEGPKVLRIVPNGVVLEYNGQKFLLPRP